MEETKRQFLEGHKQDLQKGIWGFEIDVRHLERQKIIVRDSELGDIENGIQTAKTKIKIYQARMELIDDILKEE